ncbi:MAG: hypothetical protein AAF708_03700 [Deinococcota bacterium]
MTRFRFLCLMSLGLFLLVSCSGGGGGEPNVEPSPEVSVGGFVAEQSRNVIIIMTDDQLEQAQTGIQDLNDAIAIAEASRGVVSDTPAIRGMNAAVMGLLQTQQTMDGENVTPLFNFAREFVVAVQADGEVIATSPLTRLTSDTPDDLGTGTQSRLSFDLDIPTDEDIALLIAEPDGRGNWICKGLLEYQTLDGQRTVASEQSIYNFPSRLGGGDDKFNTGLFQFNELTANLASRTVATSANVMADDLPDNSVQNAIVTLEDAAEFQDGSYRFCNNPDLARNQVTADINWQSDIFNVGNLPPDTNPDLTQGEAAVYDFSIALLLETINEQDADGNPVVSNRLVGSSPIDIDGNVNIDLVRSSLENLNATLFFTDVAFFDADKRRFPLTPSYQFDASVQLDGAATQTQQDNSAGEQIDLGQVDGGLAYVSGRTLAANGETTPNADVIMVLDDEQLSFNVATSDENGFYELLIPTDNVDPYILYGQDAAAEFGGLAGNDNSEVRFTVQDSEIISQDIVLDVPLQGGVPLRGTCVNTPQEAVILSTQAEVDALSGCQRFNVFSLIIGNAPDDGTFPPTNITNLSGLAQLERVEGSLLIQGNPQLTTLSPLRNLETVNGAFSIFENDSLVTLEGLENLQSIGGFSTPDIGGGSFRVGLDIQVNATLESIAAISNVTSVDGNIVITNNPLLVNLEGVENIANYNNSYTVLVSNNSRLTCTPQPPFTVDFSTGNAVNCPASNSF